MGFNSFLKYSKEHVHFYEEDVSPILEYGLALTWLPKSEYCRFGLW